MNYKLILVLPIILVYWYMFANMNVWIYTVNYFGINSNVLQQTRVVFVTSTYEIYCHYNVVQKSDQKT